jgi:hypothetical protein
MNRKKNDYKENGGNEGHLYKKKKKYITETLTITLHSTLPHQNMDASYHIGFHKKK